MSRSARESEALPLAATVVVTIRRILSRSSAIAAITEAEFSTACAA